MDGTETKYVDQDRPGTELPGKRAGMKYQLYRQFDKSGKLLYVGISLSAMARLLSHQLNAKWFYRIAKIEIENFPNKLQAQCAERRAIMMEKPRFNRMPGVQLRADVYMDQK